MRRILVLAFSILAVAAVVPTASAAAPAAATETLSAKGRVIVVKGMNYVRVEATGRTGSKPSTGRVDVVLYGSASIPEGLQVVAEIYTLVAHLDLVDGKAAGDVPITGALIRKAKPPYTLHSSCCSLIVKRPGTGAVSSPMVGIAGLPQQSYYGTVTPSSTALYLDVVSRGATGRAMDTKGQIAWAAKLSSGTARSAPVKAMVESAAYRRLRAIQMYQRWLGRRPTASEEAYWTERLARETTSQADLAMAVKPVARDAGGTTNAQRGVHLAKALHLDSGYGTSFARRLDAGTPWSTVVRDAYWTSAALEKRISEMGARSGYTPSMSSLGSQLRRTGDERGVLIAVLSTIPSQVYVTY